MLCSSCGAPISEGAKFCSKCGTPVAAEQATPEPVAYTEPEPVQSTYEQPAYEQPAYEQPAYEQTVYQQPAYDQQAPAGQYAPIVPAAQMVDMPSKGVAIALIVVGFVCGVIWGIIGVVQYGPMKAAIQRGDVVEAKDKFGVIRNATIIGVVINILFLIAQLM